MSEGKSVRTGDSVHSDPVWLRELIALRRRGNTWRTIFFPCHAKFPFQTKSSDALDPLPAVSVKHHSGWEQGGGELLKFWDLGKVLWVCFLSQGFIFFKSSFHYPSHVKQPVVLIWNEFLSLVWKHFSSIWLSFLELSYSLGYNFSLWGKASCPQNIPS